MVKVLMWAGGVASLVPRILGRRLVPVMKLRTKSAAVILLAVLAIVTLAAPQAHAGLIVGTDAAQFAVLGQFSNNQTNFNNGTITGDVGIGTPRAFTISNASVDGNIRFGGVEYLWPYP